ncbi:GntR family transcriptional regulator [Solwaraspora sp. WMMD406]|uniref:GntR family transcriptional regulator n=1 Tax=Solwaraspora sp. WMMD406 TaxID=3016095 RepID=UPI002416569C|nr:GntR family transcriptional regulator [Solwaraspora sp. WMMD406]MDG4767796.1 GntR family transcriptional regulator [Solwaraspora sp. WMMD406]
MDVGGANGGSADPDAVIDHKGPVPPYRQLAAILKARIGRGDWAPGRAVPAESRLVQEYGVARSTVRRSIALLVDEGVVFVVPQRGTYVAQR